MKILYYLWKEFSSEDMISTFEKLGYSVTSFSCSFTDYFYAEEVEKKAASLMKLSKYDIIFSFDYFPFLSSIAMKYSIPYVCWVYDCPHSTLYSKTITNECNYIFLFDQNMLPEVKRLGAKNVYHLVLGVNAERLNQHLNLFHSMNIEQFTPKQYEDEISFVGSLYENNLYDEVKYLPEYLKGYVDGIMDAQKQFWGIDLVRMMINRPLAEQLSKYIKLEQQEHYTYSNETIFCNMIQKKITSEERIFAFNLLADAFPVSIYSGSPKNICKNAYNKGPVSYCEEMPKVFHYSKINLNITLRSITSGIPLRAMDILACGGFLLTNYQPELCEYFEEGKDFVHFEDFNDMFQKVSYYLKHNNERNEIAFCGWKKAQEQFSYIKQVKKMLETIKK